MGEDFSYRESHNRTTEVYKMGNQFFSIAFDCVGEDMFLPYGSFTLLHPRLLMAVVGRRGLRYWGKWGLSSKASGGGVPVAGITSCTKIGLVFAS